MFHDLGAGLCQGSRVAPASVIGVVPVDLDDLIALVPQVGDEVTPTNPSAPV